MFSSIILSCFLTFGQADITLPPSSKAEVGVFVPITATTKGEVVQFVAIDPGLSIFPANLLVDKKTTVVVGSKPGKYRVLAYTSIENKPSLPAYTLVIIGNSDDNDNNNNKPDEGLASSLKGIYGGLQENDKAANVKKLATVYSLAATETDNANNKTVGDLLGAYKSILFKTMPPGRIQPIRDTISDFLDSKLGTDASMLTTNLDDATRKKFKQYFMSISNTLGGLNG